VTQPLPGRADRQAKRYELTVAFRVGSIPYALNLSEGAAGRYGLDPRQVEDWRRAIEVGGTVE
jgi:hypothetical protein